MAVLPTPGSPIRTGLFLVRRDSTWMTRRISLVPSDDRVELALASQLREIATIALERLVFSFRVLVGDALGAANGGQDLQDPVARHVSLGECLGGHAAALLGGEREEQVLGADVLVGELLRFALGLREDSVQARRQGRLSAPAGARQTLERLSRDLGHLGRAHPELLEDAGHDAVLLLAQRHEEMFRLDQWVPGIRRVLLCGDQRLLRLLGHLVHRRHGSTFVYELEAPVSSPASAS